MSIRMIKMCDESLARLLSIIFWSSFNFCIYPSTRKKVNVKLVHKKDGKQCMSSYRPVSLLPVFGNFFEKIVFNEISSYVIQKNFSIQTNLIFDHLISVYNSWNISSFDSNSSLEVCSIFLGISKAFEKVRHESLFYKLNSF